MFCNFRPALNSDIKALLKIENESFDEFRLSKASFYYHIKRNFLYVYEDEKGEILGYILVFNHLKIPRIYSLAISKNARGFGLGNEFMKFITSKFKNLRLEVNVNNQKAINLYTKFGFLISKTLPNYYENSDGFEMIFKNNP